MRVVEDDGERLVRALVAGAADARAEGQYQPVDCEWPHAPHGVP